MIVQLKVAARRRRGVAVVETAFLAPFLILLMFGIWEFGVFLNAAQVVSNAAREGGRQASTGTVSASSVGTGTNYLVQTYVARYLNNSGLPLTGGTIAITVTNVTQSLACTLNVTADTSTPPNLTFTQVGSNPSNDPVQYANQGDSMRVDVTYPYANIRWFSPSQSSVNLIFAGTYQSIGASNISASASWTCLRDVPIVINSTIPGAPE